MRGAWWVEQSEFQRILGFAHVHGISDPMAARILCGVPPEWSDMGLLVRVRLRADLLAWRGLANSVIVPHPNGGSQVTMLHQNALSQRRLYQLCIPGLNVSGANTDPIGRAFIFDGEWRFSPSETVRGWLYV
jgi:hypothetical protein